MTTIIPPCAALQSAADWRASTDRSRTVDMAILYRQTSLRGRAAEMLTRAPTTAAPTRLAWPFGPNAT